MDIHVTSDSKAVIIHDSEYDGSLIKDYTFEDLKFVSSGKGTPVPELTELFEMFSGKQLYFQIELKGEGSEDIVPELAGILGISGMIRYTSFVHLQSKKGPYTDSLCRRGAFLSCFRCHDPCYLLEICGASFCPSKGLFTPFGLSD